MSEAARGARLYALVEAYARLGDHRTGTAVDDATRDWLGSEIERRRGTVEELAYSFERYSATARVTAGGHELPVAPLFYSGLGEVESHEPYVTEVDGRGAGSAVDDALAIARAAGYRAAVLATRSPDGALVAMNRNPVTPPGPVGVLAPGGAIDQLREGPVHVRADARTEPGTSATVVGRFGDGRGTATRPVVVTAPLTGWFACAGECGTGIAVALETAEALASRHPVVLVHTTGHEIGFVGARDYLARTQLRPRLVLHLGSSAAVAAPDAHGVALVDGLDPARIERVDRALAPIGFRLAQHVGAWPTESQGWRSRAPVVSLAGSFDRIHTPDDVPDAVTSSSRLEAVTGVMLALAGDLV